MLRHGARADPARWPYLQEAALAVRVGDRRNAASCAEAPTWMPSKADGVALDVLKALASEPRLRILRYLGRGRPGRGLGLPPSTAAMHVAELEQAGLMH